MKISIFNIVVFTVVATLAILTHNYFTESLDNSSYVLGLALGMFWVIWIQVQDS